MSMEQLDSTATIKLDGNEIESICRELQKGIKRERKGGSYFQADLLQSIIDKLQAEKIKFHNQWAKQLLSKRKTALR